MITNEHNGLELGLRVIFDKEKYDLITHDGKLKEYPIGGLICEFVRLVPADIKPIIMSCPGLKEIATRETVGTFLGELDRALQESLDPVPATIIMTELLNFTLKWFQFKEHNAAADGTDLKSEDSMAQGSKEIMRFVFKDTGYDGVGAETVGQLILTAYVHFADDYITAKHIFQSVISNEDDSEEKSREKKEEDSRAVDALLMLYGDYMDEQHIDFKIFATNEGFQYLYTIQSTLSLLIFEMANSINKDAKFVKCANCGQYFVPEGRSDALYCTYPSPQNAEKSCRDVGAQVTRANKEKNDVTTKEYRKVYMRYKMTTKRHPEDRESAEKFRTLTSDVKEWRNRLAHGTATAEEFMEWLGGFQ